MGHYNNQSGRTKTESDAILTLATEATEVKLRAGEPFTALDISNTLKAKKFPVRHGEVAAVVRGLYVAGGMTPFGYDREMIPVETESGDTAQAYLYRHNTQTANDYAGEAQDTLPPVPADQARPLDDVIPAGMPLSPLAQTALMGMVGNAVINGNGSPHARHRSPYTRGTYRRDGAIAVPRSVVAQSGWQVGDTLELAHDAVTDTLTLQPVSSATGVTGVLVCVWSDLRVRIAKTKVHVVNAVVSGTIAANPAQKPNFTVDANGVRIEP